MDVEQVLKTQNPEENMMEDYIKNEKINFGVAFGLRFSFTWRM